MDTSTIGRESSDSNDNIENIDELDVEVESMTMALDIESQRRAWIEVLTELVDLEVREGTDEQVASAFNRMKINACEAINRVLRATMIGEVVED